MPAQTEIPGDITLVTSDPVAVPDPEGLTAQVLDFLGERRWIIPAAILLTLGIAVAVRRRR